MQEGTFKNYSGYHSVPSSSRCDLLCFPGFVSSLSWTILQVRWGMLSSKLLYCSHTFGVFYHQPTHNLPLLWWAWHKRAFNPLFEQRGLIGFAILPEQDSSTMSPDGARALGKEEMIPRLEYHNAGKLYLQLYDFSRSPTVDCSTIALQYYSTIELDGELIIGTLCDQIRAPMELSSNIARPAPNDTRHTASTQDYARPIDPLSQDSSQDPRTNTVTTFITP